MARRTTASRRRRRQPLTAIRFRPPSVFTSSSELLLPVMHTNYSELKAVREVFNGSAFYVKAIDKTPRGLSGGYMIMLKLKPELKSGTLQ